MKKLCMTLIVVLGVQGLWAQVPVTYFYPTKSLKVTVTYTEVTVKKKTKLATEDCNMSKECESYIVIKDPVTVEEVVLPDLAHPVELKLPEISRSGASFSYSFQWADNGVASAFNASREPLVVSVISGAVGLVSSAVSLVTKALPIIREEKLDGGEEAYVEVVEEKKFREIQWLNFNCEKNADSIVFQTAGRPRVTVNYSRKSPAPASGTLKMGSGNITVKSRIPSYYLVEVLVYDNQGLPLEKVISTHIPVPQCGAVAEYSFDLRGGKRTVAFQMNPSNGMLTKLEYKKESNLKASQEAIQASLAQVSQAISDIRQLQDDRRFKEMDAEIARLKKENELRQELKTKADLEAALNN